MSSWRYLLQRAGTEEFLHTDLDFRRDSLRWELSAVGSCVGTVAPDLGLHIAHDGRPLIEKWSTLLFAEADGIIRWGGIITDATYDGPRMKLTVSGMATYPHGIPYLGKYVRTGVHTVDVMKHVWEHIQSFPDGNLNMTVTGSTRSIPVGTAAVGKEPADPYELLWWDAPDCGREIDRLAAETPFDWAERHRWDGEQIKHEIVAGYPRLGTRRTDLSFTDEMNITGTDALVYEGDDFANEVVAIGAGEGAGSVRSSTGKRDGRLRRPYVYTAKDVSSATRLASLARDELVRHANPLTVPSITVRQHPAAPIASWNVGDDIRVQVTAEHLGEVDLWHRITAWELLTDNTARLFLQRSDTFTYGG